MGYEVETYCWLALPAAGCRAAAWSLCVQAVGSDLGGLEDHFQ